MFLSSSVPLQESLPNDLPHLVLRLCCHSAQGPIYKGKPVTCPCQSTSRVRHCRAMLPSNLAHSLRSWHQPWHGRTGREREESLADWHWHLWRKGNDHVPQRRPLPVFFLKKKLINVLNAQCGGKENAFPAPKSLQLLLGQCASNLTGFSHDSPVKKIYSPLFPYLYPLFPQTQLINSPEILPAS